MTLEPMASTAPGVQVAAYGPVVLSCFYGWPRPASVRAAVEAQRTVISRLGKVMTLSIVPAIQVPVVNLEKSELNLPPDEQQAALAATAGATEELSQFTVASALVVLPTGLIGVMVRSFMAMMSLVSRSRVPLQTFRTLPAATHWLSTVDGTLGPFPALAAEAEAWLTTHAAGSP